MRSNNSFRLSGDLYETIETNVFASLMDSLHDVFLPTKLAPLELSSMPIAVPDRMAIKRDPKATALAIVINGLILLAILWFGTRKIGAVTTPTPAKVITLVYPSPPPLTKIPPKVIVMSGGGGQPTPVPIAHGNLPKLEPKPILMPTMAPKIETRIPMQPALNIQTDLKMAKTDLPNIGMSNSPSIVVSMGNGVGAGLGSGNGNGLGSGTGGNYGGGVFKVGGGVSQPQVLYAPDPGFTEEARQAKVAGKVVVYLQVNEEGHPMHVHVIRGLGMGLDEKAVEAVRQYRFKPAMKDGHPVTVEMNVDVNFQIF
jgi:protein TonB